MAPKTGLKEAISLGHSGSERGTGIQCLRNGDIYPQSGCMFLGNRYIYSFILQILIKHLLYDQVLRIQQSTIQNRLPAPL